MAKGRTTTGKDVSGKKQVRQSINVQDNNDFIKIKQTQELNEMQQIGMKCGKINEYTGDYEMECGDYLYKIMRYNEESRKIRTSAQQLCLAIVHELDARNFAAKTINLDIKDYMNLRGLHDAKEARKQMLYDVNVLYRLEVIHDHSHFRFVRKFDDGKRGVIPVTVDDDFFELLKEKGHYMSLPPQLFKLSAKRNPNSFYLLYKIAIMKRINLVNNPKRANTISMETLIRSSPELPGYEKVMETDKAVTKRIIEPTIRDLDVLTETLKWSVSDSCGKSVEKSELLKMPYNQFIKM